MNEYRKHFPMLEQNFIYFNSASTSLKPISVINEITEYYTKYGVNTNRGVDSIGYNVTRKYEEVRDKVANFINSSRNEIVFTRGTTDSLNLVAMSFGNLVLKKDDEIVITVIEHHSNFLPWQELCNKVGAKLIVAPVSEDGTIESSELEKIMTNKVKIVAINHISNVMGGINNLKELAKVAHKYNSYFVVDGAQGIVHERIDVQKLDVDFYAFSGHKLYSPMGVGILYGKKELLDLMPPIVFGGEMIDSYNNEQSTYKDAPYKFEAGTMMVPSVLGLGKGIDFLLNIGYEKINAHIKELRKYLVDNLITNIKDIEVYNKDNVDSSVVTFNIKTIHAHDIATLLDDANIIVRAGHHCAEPYMQSRNLLATVRISLGLYNNISEVDKLVNVLKGAGDYIDVLFK